MKVYIMTDLEGVAGVVDFESQTYNTGKYYEIAKGLLTEEVNSCCDGLVEVGVDEIFVSDGHGSGGILPEKIHREAKLLHGRPLPKFWEIDKKWDCIFLLSHHSMHGTKNGNLNHTYSSRSIVKMELNGEKIGEIGIGVYLAGWFNIPVLFVSGDEAACEEAGKYVPNIEKAIVKWGITRTSAISLSPIKAREIIKEKAKKAIEKIDKIKPVKFEGECELLIEFISTSDAFGFVKRPFFEKVNETTVKVKGKNFLELFERYFY